LVLLTLKHHTYFFPEAQKKRFFFFFFALQLLPTRGSGVSNRKNKLGGHKKTEIKLKRNPGF
jgi:hypothetical protein